MIGSDSENGGMFIGALADGGALKIDGSNMKMGALTLVALDSSKPSDKSIVNKYTVGNDIQITNSSIDVGSQFDAHGRRVIVADDSEIDARYGMLWAASEEIYDEETNRIVDYITDSDNEVKIDNSKLAFDCMLSEDEAKFENNKLSIRGSKISVIDSEITNTGHISLKAYSGENKGNITVSNSGIKVDVEGGKIEEIENLSLKSNGNIIIKDSTLTSNDYASIIASADMDNNNTYTADNKISISGSSITAPGKMRIYGSSIDIMNGAEIVANDNLSIEAKSKDVYDGNNFVKTEASADNILNVTTDSKIKSVDGDVKLTAGRATIAGHLYKNKTVEEPFEYEKAVGKITILADSSSVPDPEPVLPEIPDVPVAPIEGLDKITEDTPMDEVAEVIQKQVNTPAQANKAISQVVVELNISNEKKAEVVRTIIENVEVSAEADTHVQNMSAAVQNEGSVATVSAETASVGNETAGADMSADVTVDGTDVQE